MPTLLRVGAAETLAYRAEFLVWMLTSTLPLIMLGLWMSVASEAPFAHYGQEDFIAYYLAALIVRNLTGSWVVWQLNEDIRRGQLSLKLLRPIHPFLTYAALHLSAIPLRAVIAVPVAVILLFSSARPLIATDPVSLAALAAALVGAWALTFLAQLLIGSLAFFMEKSLAVFEIYVGVFAVLSGYFVPLDLLPGWIQGAAALSPFRFMLSFPVEILTSVHVGSGRLFELLVLQWIYVAAFTAAANLLWRRAVRRYQAFGS